MFHGRPALLRVTAGAVAGLSCLAVAACGGSLRAETLRASSIADPLAGQSGSKVEAEATADAVAAPSLTINGTVTDSGKNITIDLGIKRGQGCAGKVSESGVGSMQLVVIGRTLYIKPDNEFWKSAAGNTSGASAAIALLAGRYIKFPPSDSSATGIGAICDVSNMLNSGGKAGHVTRGAVDRLGGIRVLPLKLSDGSTEYVTDTIKPEFVEDFAPKGTQGGAGKATLSVGAPVKLAAPPASQVIDGSKLGMTGNSVPSFI